MENGRMEYHSTQLHTPVQVGIDFFLKLQTLHYIFLSSDCEKCIMCVQCTYVKTGNVMLKTSNEKSKQPPGFESGADYRVSHIEMGKLNWL